MPNPTRQPNGITNAISSSNFGDMGQLDPSKFQNYFDDFNTFDTGDFSITGSATVSLAEESGGALLISSTTGQSGTVDNLGRSFLVEPGKKIFFKTRFKVSNNATTNFQVGIVSSGGFSDNSIMFRKLSSGSASVSFSMFTNPGDNASAAAFDIENDTYVTAGFVYDGIDKFIFFVNDNRIGSVTNNNPTGLLTPHLQFNNSTATETMLIDYFFLAKER